MNIQMAMEELKMENALLGVRSPMKVARNNLAIAALQEQAEREKGCEYCKCGYDLSTGNVCEPSLYIQGNTLLALRYDEPDSEAEINYCPMCGKRLK